MRKIYHLKTCDTCRRIIKDLKIQDLDFEMIEIKSNPITSEQIEEMRSMTDSYESLFSKRSRKYKELGLKEKNLSEADLKNLILEEYTFLKRPVFIIDSTIFIGNSPKNVEAVRTALA